MKPLKIIPIAVFCLLLSAVQAAESAIEHELKFIKNQKQFHPDVLYLAELNGGAVFLEQSAFTYVFYKPGDLEKTSEYLHHCDYLDPAKNIPVLNGHAYKMHLDGANLNSLIAEAGMCKEYYNYFFGQDQTKWAGNVPLFSEIDYREIYPNIDLKVYSENRNLKYDFIVRSGGEANKIRLNFEGIDGIAVANGNLKIRTSVGDIIEQKPYAYQNINGKKVEIPCNYQLNNKNVVFHLPRGYDHNYELVIDPVIIASTYSGTTYRAYAHSATYDHDGNIYSSGRAFSPNANGSGAGYPATLGAFQTTHHGGYQDICVSKYNPDGSALLWATYLGGSEQEQPHSLYVNANNQIYIYGTSNSPNYPVSSTGYQRTNPTDNFGNHLSDIIVTKLNAAGSGIIGSTYVGGRTENDGINWTSVHNYFGDYFKGEIVLDANDNAYISSYTRAADFPTTSGVIQPSYGGGYQDGVIFKLNSDLSALSWSTFYGGPAEDACYGLKLDSDGNLFVTGAVSSNILTNTSGTIHPAYLGGSFDAFVTHIRGDGQTVLKSTYFGSANQEQAYLLDLDRNGNVYIFGATPASAIQATPGAYQAPLNGSFIAKLNPALDSILFITTFNQLAPTAMLVDDCNYIYAVGHGGINTNIGTCRGFQLTPDALQRDSGGFYLMILEPDASALKFGSYYGPANSHVDGGTCRFDKRGIIYTALCTDDPNLHTTPNAFHTTNLSNDFDNTVFKIDFQPPRTEASGLATVQGSSDTSMQIGSCSFPVTVQFLNRSTNAVQYIWYFGTGDSSTQQQPVYSYSDTGSFHVVLIGRDSASCNKNDTVYILINIHPLNANISHIDAACNVNDGSATIDTAGNTDPLIYQWSNGGSSATISGLAPGTYQATVSGPGGCSSTASVIINTLNMVVFSVTAGNTTCNSTSGMAAVNITAGSAPFSYLWSTGETIASIANLQSGIYTVTVTGAGNCSASDSTTVVSSNGVTLSASSVSTTCGNSNGLASAIVITGTAPISYLWSNGATGSTAVNLAGGNYIATVTDFNGCSATVTAHVDSSHVDPMSIVSNTSIMCSEDSARLCAPPGYLSYYWNTGQTDSCIIAKLAGNYYVLVTDSNSCAIPSNHLSISVFPSPAVSISVNGDTLTGYNAISYQWNLNGVPLPGANSPTHIVNQTGDYTLAVIDSNGCRAVSTVITVSKTSITATGDEEYFMIYPNPFSGNLVFAISGNELTQPLLATIIDESGRKVMEQKIYTSPLSLNVTNLSAGIYVLRIVGKDSFTSLKIIKQ